MLSSYLGSMIKNKQKYNEKQLKKSFQNEKRKMPRDYILRDANIYGTIEINILCGIIDVMENCICCQ